MTTTQKLIWAFWIVILATLVWQFFSYNHKLDQDAIDHPTQEHFYFFHTNAPTDAAPVAHKNGADVQQKSFVVENDAPNRGSFTCHVTVKNVGNQKAANIQVRVRPYRGTSNYDEDAGNQHPKVLSDDDPTSKFGDWLVFPDLAPGESSTQSVSFISRTDVKPGTNPNPEIVFETAKAKQPPIVKKPDE